MATKFGAQCLSVVVIPQRTVCKTSRNC